MSAPLSGAAREVLRALAHGLDLREINGEWTFVGYFQDRAHSGVSSETMRELFGSGFICHLGCQKIAITREGEHVLFQSTTDDIAAALKWLRETE
jgi:hypothetical protein